MAFEIASSKRIAANIIAYIIANSDNKVTDISKGSVLRSIIEALALALEDVQVTGYEMFLDSLMRVRDNVFAFSRKGGVKSTISTLIFNRDVNSEITGIISIPVGTLITTESGIVFSTSAVATIADGVNASMAIPSVAEIVGVSGNVGIGMVINLVNNIPGVSGCNNTVAALGGSDLESDSLYDRRFRIFIEGLGKVNVAGIVSKALSINGVNDAKIVNHIPPIPISSTDTNKKNATLYLKSSTINIVNNVNTAMFTEPDIQTGRVGNFVVPGIHIEPVVAVAHNYDINLEITRNELASNANIREAVIYEVDNFISELRIGESVHVSQLIDKAFNVSGVKSVIVVINSGNTTDLAITESEYLTAVVEATVNSE